LQGFKQKHKEKTEGRKRKQVTSAATVQMRHDETRKPEVQQNAKSKWWQQQKGGVGGRRRKENRLNPEEKNADATSERGDREEEEEEEDDCKLDGRRHPLAKEVGAKGTQ
jgi:hypothetical protein